MKLAVIGTPRSGNTWLRRLLATAYGLGGGPGMELAVHDPAEADWETSPSFVVQVHVRREPGLASQFARAGVRAVVPKRHPFDVLISILQYATHQAAESARWLGGEGGDESGIVGLDPCHDGFLGYARSPRVAALLDVSPSWSVASGTIGVRYEDLVARPEPTLVALAETIGRPPVVDWPSALAANTMERLNRSHGRGHIWQGRPGLWRMLLTAEAARPLADAHRALLDDGAYDAEADPELTGEQALANWRSLVGAGG